MTYSGRRFHGIREISRLEAERHVDQADQNRDLQKRTDNSGKGLSGVDPKDGDGNGDGKLKII
jgi:hypothetical protein